MKGVLRAAALAIVTATAVAAAVLGSGCQRPAVIVPAQHLPIYVSPDGLGDYRTLGRAIREAPAGATIFLDPGTYRISRTLVVYRPLRVAGPGAALTTIESSSSDLVLGIARRGRLSLSGVTLKAVPGNEGRVPVDVVQMQGGRLDCTDCVIAGAVRGRVPQRTASGVVWPQRGGAGVRLTGDARARLSRCTFSGNDQAGVAREPSASVSCSDCRGTGPGERPLVTGPAGPVDRARVARFTRPLVRELLKDLQVPGAAVAVVRGDTVLLLGGYGFADVARREPVDPVRTRFRIASVTKLFTTAAVLQLWQQGSLSLGEPVSRFVRGLSPGVDGFRRLTVSDLLVHASGYDDRWISIASPSAAAAPSLTGFIEQDAPSRVLPPGSVSSYTNFSMTLAGQVVAVAAGMPYETYVRGHILGPLGMRRTGFTPPERALALPYAWNGGFRELPLTYFNAAPSGQLFSTAADMSLFLRMQLSGGAGVLAPGTVALMQAQHFANVPQVPGYAYGFAEGVAQNRRVLEQSGDFDGYSSRLLLVPGESLGIFVVANAERQDFCERFIARFLQHYYPVDHVFPRPQPPSLLRGGLDQFTGTYRLVRDPHHTLDRWLSFTPRRELSVGRDGDQLLIEDTRYVQLEPAAFRSLYTEDYVAFGREAGGQIAYAFTGTDAYQRLAWYETYTDQRRFIIGFSIVLGLTMVAWVLAPLLGLLWKAPAWLRSLLRRQPFALRDPRPARAARLVAGVVAALDLVFLTLIAAFLTQDAIAFGVPGWLTALLAVPLLALALTAVQAGFTVAAWVRGWWTATGRALYTFIFIVAVLFLWFLTYWNLLGFKY